MGVIIYHLDAPRKLLRRPGVIAADCQLTGSCQIADWQAAGELAAWWDS
jgi:hypothetical protein